MRQVSKKRFSRCAAQGVIDKIREDYPKSTVNISWNDGDPIVLLARYRILVKDVPVLLDSFSRAV